MFSLTNWMLAFAPVLATVVGAALATALSPNERIVSGIRHFAAGVVFAAAASEILPDVLHGGSPVVATIVGGLLGLGLMLFIKKAEEWIKGPTGLLATVGIDLLVDGLVLGIGFLAGGTAGLLLGIAVTVEVLSLALALTATLAVRYKSRLTVIGVVGGLSLLLPVGAVLAIPAASLPPVYFTGLLAMGLVSLLYLVTEELLVEAHEVKDSPFITAMFFVGFLGLIVLEELIV